MKLIDSNVVEVDDTNNVVMNLRYELSRAEQKAFLDKIKYHLESIGSFFVSDLTSNKVNGYYLESFTIKNLEKLFNKSVERYIKILEEAVNSEEG